MSRKLPGAPSPHPHHPPDWESADATAFQALARGDAASHLQQRALKWIIERAAGTYDMSYRGEAEGGDRATAFAEGRRFVGLQVVKLLNLDIKKLKDDN